MLRYKTFVSGLILGGTLLSGCVGIGGVFTEPDAGPKIITPSVDAPGAGGALFDLSQDEFGVLAQRGFVLVNGPYSVRATLPEDFSLYPDHAQYFRDMYAPLVLEAAPSADYRVAIAGVENTTEQFVVAFVRITDETETRQILGSGQDLQYFPTYENEDSEQLSTDFPGVVRSRHTSTVDEMGRMDVVTAVLSEEVGDIMLASVVIGSESSRAVEEVLETLQFGLPGSD